MYVLFKVVWYWFVSILEGVVTVKAKIVQYVSYKFDVRISADKAYLKF